MTAGSFWGAMWAAVLSPMDDIRSLAAQRNTHSSQCDYVEASILKWEAPAMGAALLYIDEFVKKI